MWELRSFFPIEQWNNEEEWKETRIDYYIVLGKLDGKRSSSLGLKLRGKNVLELKVRKKVKKDQEKWKKIKFRGKLESLSANALSEVVQEEDIRKVFTTAVKEELIQRLQGDLFIAVVHKKRNKGISRETSVIRVELKKLDQEVHVDQETMNEPKYYYSVCLEHPLYYKKSSPNFDSTVYKLIGDRLTMGYPQLVNLCADQLIECS